MFTNDEINLICIYKTDSRVSLIAELTQMRGYIGAEEAEMLTLTDSALVKLRHMSDAEYAALELFPDFDEAEN